MLSWFLAAAIATPPTLLHQQDPIQARRRVWVDMRTLEVEILTPAALLRESEPYLVRTPLDTPCEGPPATNASILRLLDESEQLRVAMRAIDAWDRIRAALSAWSCIAEPADAVVGARLHFLAGIAEHAQGRPDAATDAFRAALRSDPQLAWDEDFAPDARPAFEAAHASTPEVVTVHVVPDAAQIALRVDGRSVVPQDGSLALNAGPHLIQVLGGPTFWVDLSEDDWLVVPKQIPDDLLDSVRDEAGRTRLAGLLVGSDVARPVLVVDRRSTWAWDDGWTEHRPAVARRVGRPLMIMGGAVLAGGLTWMLLESNQANQRLPPYDPALDSIGHEALLKEHRTNRGRYAAAAGVTAIGGLAAIGGGAMVILAW